MTTVSAPVTADAVIAPLPARSVALSLVLGANPNPMTSADLTSAAERFEIPVATLRVALTRAVAAGDLARDAEGYTVGPRLHARQVRQVEVLGHTDNPWDGEWEMAIVVVSGRPGTERAALRDQLMGARLAELREGVWTRPANLGHAADYADIEVLTTFRARPDDDATELAARLWDLSAWAGDGHGWLQRLRAVSEPAPRLAVAAQLVRHLTSDPLLPAELLPADWPGAELRTAYADYQAELRES